MCGEKVKTPEGCATEYRIKRWFYKCAGPDAGEDMPIFAVACSERTVHPFCMRNSTWLWYERCQQISDLIDVPLYARRSSAFFLLSSVIDMYAHAHTPYTIASDIFRAIFKSLAEFAGGLFILCLSAIFDECHRNIVSTIRVEMCDTLIVCTI